MRNPIGLAFVFAATASIAVASGGEEPKKAPEGKNKRTLENLANTVPAGDVKVTAKPGSGITFDMGDDFSVRIANRVQLMWAYSAYENSADTNNFSARRARTTFKGHIWDKNNTFKVQLDWLRSPALLDAWFRWGFYHNENYDLGLRLGLQKPHFGREYTGSSGNLEHINRSVVSDTFSGRRVLGAYLQGAAIDKKLHWNLGAVNGDPATGSSAAESGHAAANADNELNFIGDVRFDPMGDFGDESYVQGDLEHTKDLMGTVGASVLVGNHRNAANTMDVDTLSFNFYTAWKYMGAHLLGELFLRNDEPDVAGSTDTNHTGFAVGGSYTLPPSEEGGSQWGFALRYGMITNDDNGSFIASTSSSFLRRNPLGDAKGDLSEIEVTISNYYHKHKLKTQLGYRHQMVDFDSTATSSIVSTTDADNDFVELLFTWAF